MSKTSNATLTVIKPKKGWQTLNLKSIEGLSLEKEPSIQINTIFRK